MPERSLSDFAHFYATDLVKELKRLEVVRKAVMRRVIILIAVLGAIFATAAAVDIVWRGFGWFIVVAATMCLGIGSFLYRYLTSDYVFQFKTGIVGKIVSFLDPGLQYEPNGLVDRVVFVSSRIFERNPDRLRGDDHVFGKIGETRIEFSGLHAEYKEETYSSRGSRRKWHTIFKGLFFAADFNKKFYGKTVVLPDTAEKLFGHFGAALQSLNKSRGELVKLEDPEFEKLFVVYGDDQIESRYVLSTSLMERIVAFRKKTNRPVYLSFVGSQVFVAVPYRKALFQPTVFSRLTDFKVVEGCFEDLELALGIVDDLNLNTRVWTRSPAAGPATGGV
ncbi:MAG TPA: DUF3137 domain-containing protein [bacterium]|nr:DUF3137 domain-containing protein [bacterium]